MDNGKEKRHPQVLAACTKKSAMHRGGNHCCFPKFVSSKMTYPMLSSLSWLDGRMLGWEVVDANSECRAASDFG